MKMMKKKKMMMMMNKNKNKNKKKNKKKKQFPHFFSRFLRHELLPLSVLMVEECDGVVRQRGACESDAVAAERHARHLRQLPTRVAQRVAVAQIHWEKKKKKEKRKKKKKEKNI